MQRRILLVVYKEASQFSKGSYVLHKHLAQFLAAMSDKLIRFLDSIPIPCRGNNLLQVLNDLGVKNSADLRLLKESDLKNSGIVT